MSSGRDLNSQIIQPIVTDTDAVSQPKSVWSYAAPVAICIIMFGLFAIAVAIVLSLIPLYIPKKETIPFDETGSKTSLNIVFGTDITDGSSKTVTDLPTLSKDMASAFDVKNLDVDSGSFLKPFSASSRRKRQTVDINNVQCPSGNSIGDYFATSIRLENKETCRTAACNQAYFARIQQKIQTLLKTITLTMKFTDGTTRTVRLTFCSFGNPIRTFSTQTFLTKCAALTSGKKKREVKSTGETKLKMYPPPRTLPNRVLLDNVYLVEFATDVSSRDPFEIITRSLKATHNIDRSAIQKRQVINTDLFSGISIAVNDKNAHKALELIDEVVAIYPVYSVTHPQVSKLSANQRHASKRSISSKATEENLSNFVNSHNLTGVNQVHSELGNYGRGVRVAIIDFGVYYYHPALGGCFGSTCKVAFGYDFVGDDYNPYSDPPNLTVSPDSDPLDNCSSDASGTQIAGIIAGNTTGITETFFASNVPLIGVAPQVTLGAYRVYSCVGATPSDVIVSAIYRAQSDKADIITLSVFDPDPYGESPEAVAIRRVTDAGVYITTPAGNDGSGGVQTVLGSSAGTGAMSVASVNNMYPAGPVIVSPNGKLIVYLPGTAFGGWSPTTNLPVVVNNPNPTIDDGCAGPLVSVTGAVILFYFNEQDACGTAYRCNASANAGAVGCLLYNVGLIAGSDRIPSGSITLQDGLDIIKTINANGGSATYTFTNVVNTTKSAVGGKLTDLSSFGPHADLFFGPQLSGIGGNIYSTLSSYAAESYHLDKAYASFLDTRFSSAYVAGTLALFLASIGNPSANATSVACRPPLSTVKSIFQSTSTPVNYNDTSMLTTAARQGAGLVNAYQALTINTLFTPSELALNDTIRKAQSYTVTLRNIGNQTGSYKLSHTGAALLTGKGANDDQLLSAPIQSADYANVDINPMEFQLQPGESRNITLQFTAPTSANSALLPIYSGFIYATNSIDGKTVHLSYAGVVGDYSSTRIIVQTETSAIITSIYDAAGYYLFDFDLPYLNATDGVYIVPALAWSTRILFVEVVSTDGDGSIASTTSYGLVYSTDSNESFYMTNVARNVVSSRTQSFIRYYEKFWTGYVCSRNLAANCTRSSATRLSPGKYAIRFAVLKHFGDATKSTDFEIYRTPSFNLAY